MSDDERDPGVSRRYRELGAEEPPRALDEAILAASRRAVDARPAPLVAPTGRQRWYVPAAAAAILVLAIGVVVHVQHEQPFADGDVGPGKESPAPTSPTIEQASPRAESAQPQVAPLQQDSPVAQARKLSHPERQFTPEPPPVRPPEAKTEGPTQSPAARAPQAAPPRVLESRSGKMASRRDEASELARSAPAAAGAAAPRAEIQARTMAGAAESPEQVLERIAELRQSGRDEEADKALADFRKRYPDYAIPEAMLKRVERR